MAKRRGASLIEAIVAASLMAALSVSLLSMANGSVSLQKATREQLVAGNLVLQKWQVLAQSDYAAIASLAAAPVAGTPYSVEVIVDPEQDDGTGTLFKPTTINVFSSGKADPVHQLRQPKYKLPAPVAVIHGKAKYDVPGDFTWTVPAGVSIIWVSGAGGGGGGACGASNYDGGGGGGAAAVIAQQITVSAGSTLNIHVATGGAGGKKSGGGGACTIDAAQGDQSRITGYLTLAGGMYGGTAYSSGVPYYIQYYSAATGTRGGAGGQQGGQSMECSITQMSYQRCEITGRGNYGGGTVFGTGGAPGTYPNNSGTGYGSGGAGGIPGYSGGDGAPGFLLIEW